MNRLFVIASSALLLGGCASTSATQDSAPVKPSQIPINDTGPISAKGLEAVMGRNAAALTSMFGTPRLDIRETVGRKLQFSGQPCILDTYLYAKNSGSEEVVTHVDARRSDGAEVDRASCVNALRRR